VDAQAGLDPCWSLTHYVGFVMTWLIYGLREMTYKASRHVKSMLKSIAFFPLSQYTYIALLSSFLASLAKQL
jgi:hypothetical protein